MITAFATSVWQIMLELSPALLLGLLIAGILHVFIPPGLVSRHLSRSNSRSVLRSVLLGIPMPLCSCGVIPTTIGLKNDGASKGAATGFLISTPQTGVDSILVSASFLGWPFALFKVLAAFVTGMIGGILVNITEPSDNEMPEERIITKRPGELRNPIVEVFRYGIFEILASIDIWILLGIIVSALITIFIPPGFLAGHSWTQGLGGMLLVLAIALPLYVCTTGSVPIAAALIAAGMPTGTALVFLMAGPATNIATLGAVYRSLGGRVMAIYLGTVAIMSIIFGLVFNRVLGPGMAGVHHHGGEASLLQLTCAVVLAALIIFLLGRRLFKKSTSAVSIDPDQSRDKTIRVRGMTCNHCVDTVKNALESVDGVEEAVPNLNTGTVLIRGENIDTKNLLQAVKEAGYITD
jgi:uncharacterized protein